MGSLSFANPAFLAALGLLAVPIGLHLMNRAMPRRIVFPSIRFILKGQEEQRGRRSLRDLLTLLARLALLALAILLCAGPRLSRPPVALGASGEETVILVDCSLSMGDEARFAAYLEASVLPLLDAHPAGSVALLASGNGILARLPLGTSRATLEDTIRGLRPQLRRGHHDEAWQALPQLFSSAANAVRTLYVCSDLQRADWTAFPDIARRLNAKLVPLPPADRPATNLAILGVTSELLSRGDDRRLRATVQIQNFGLAAATTMLTVQAGGQRIAREVELPAGAAEKTVVELDAPEGNEALAMLSPADTMAQDDRWHFWIGPRPPITVAVVTADAKSQGTELFFLRKALTTNLPALAKVEARFFGPEFFIEQNPLSFQRIILLDAPYTFGSLELDTLKAYLAAGGEVIYFPGNRAGDSLAALNSAGLSRSRFLGFQGAVHDMTAVTIQSQAQGTDVLGVFEREPSDLFLFPIYRHVRYEPPKDAAVLLTLPNDFPFLLRESVGPGSLYLFAVNLLPSWGELPTAMAFLPLLRRVLEVGIVDSGRGELAGEVGEALGPRLEQLGIDPADATIPDAPGITVVGKQPVVLNVTRGESDPRYLDELDWLTPADASSTLATSSAALSGDRPAINLRPALALVLLALVLVEILAANWR